MDKKRLIIYPILILVTIALATTGFTQFGSKGLLIPLLVTLAYFYTIFIIATRIKNNSIVDIGWGTGFVIGAWTSLIVADSPTLLSYIIVAFVTLWGCRLTFRIYKRNHGKPEDFRYAQWRKEWGDNVVLIAFLRVFTIQGIINFVVGSAANTIVINNRFNFTGPGQILVYVGLLIACTGLFFEVVGDEQLRQHIKKGTRSLLQTGLWSVTRHPNYFGEILIWSGLYIAGIALIIEGTVSPIYYLVLILSPLIMSTVLIKISTPLLEDNMAKYDGWEAYTKRVPMIFPWSGK